MRVSASCSGRAVREPVTHTSRNGTQESVVAKEILCEPKMAKLESRIAWLKNMTLAERIPIVPQYQLGKLLDRVSHKRKGPFVPRQLWSNHAEIFG